MDDHSRVLETTETRLRSAAKMAVAEAITATVGFFVSDQITGDENQALYITVLNLAISPAKYYGRYLFFRGISVSNLGRGRIYRTVIEVAPPTLVGAAVGFCFAFGVTHSITESAKIVGIMTPLKFLFYCGTFEIAKHIEWGKVVREVAAPRSFGTRLREEAARHLPPCKLRNYLEKDL